MAQKRDYYEVLGLGRGCSDDDLKKAYRRLARQYHPDVNKDDGAEAMFKEINEAYEVLRDPQRRAAYDRFGHAGVSPNGGGFGDMSGFGFGGLGDIFEEFFGFGTRSAAARQGPMRGADLRAQVSLTFEEAVFGTEKEIEITRLENCPNCGGSGAEPGSTPRRCSECGGRGEVRRVQQTLFGSSVYVTPCPRCNGRGEVVGTPCVQCRGEQRVPVTKRLMVTIPAGVDDGTQMRLAGEGEAGLRGGPAGNLYVALKVQPHRYFRRQDNDILLDLNISIVQAALGDKIKVPTLEGEEDLAIPAGTQTGASFRLRGKGVPFLRHSGRGDQIVTVHVRTPTNLNATQKKLLRELGESLGFEVTPQESRSFFEKVKDAFGV
ncbi:MAG: molecular chaperone DnaJ [Anaerolineae bacterium]